MLHTERILLIGCILTQLKVETKDIVIKRYFLFACLSLLTVAVLLDAVEDAAVVVVPARIVADRGHVLGAGTRRRLAAADLGG